MLGQTGDFGLQNEDECLIFNDRQALGSGGKVLNPITLRHQKQLKDTQSVLSKGRETCSTARMSQIF